MIEVKQRFKRIACNSCGKSTYEFPRDAFIELSIGASENNRFIITLCTECAEIMQKMLEKELRCCANCRWLVDCQASRYSDCTEGEYENWEAVINE